MERKTISFSFCLRKGGTQARLYERHTFEDSGVAEKVAKELEKIIYYVVGSESVCICYTADSSIFDVSVEWTMSREQAMLECADFFCIITGKDVRNEYRQHNIQVQLTEKFRTEMHTGVVSDDRICIIRPPFGYVEVFQTPGYPLAGDPVGRKRRAISRSAALRIKFAGDLNIVSYN
jgi:hypothetical protein